MKEVTKKLTCIAASLKAPKGQYNSFGRYNYRSCEDILEAVKPLLVEYACSLSLSDTVDLIGDRYYIKATATLTDAESGEQLSVTAYAREPEQKKGMDEPQITGTASSYARKYALNGLFCIDDTKDPDTDEYYNQTGKSTAKGKKDDRIICSVCGQEVKSQKKYAEDGSVVEVPAKTVYEKCGYMCWDCYKKATKGDQK